MVRGSLFFLSGKGLVFVNDVMLALGLLSVQYTYLKADVINSDLFGDFGSNNWKWQHILSKE